MPLLGQNPKCSVCKTTESDVWERTESDDILCEKCYDIERIVGREDSSMHPKNPVLSERNQSANIVEASTTMDTTALIADSRQSNSNINRSHALGRDLLESKFSTRKSARIKPSKSKSQTAVKAQATKGRSRRIIFKKKPIKAPSASATVVTSNHIFYKGVYWQVGDVVSVVDDDGCVYYAQLRGFLQDQYNEKSAVITWLIPTSFSPASEFDASTYILGPEEDVPRKMEYFEFVCHTPSDYFNPHKAPYAAHASVVEPGSIWTGIKAGNQPSFGSITSQDSEYGSEISNSRSLIKTETARRVKDSYRRQSANKEKKLK